MWCCCAVPCSESDCGKRSPECCGQRLKRPLASTWAVRLRKAGLGSMHELLTGDQNKCCNAAAHAKFNSKTEHYVPKLVRETVGYRGPGFYDRNCVIRFYVPVAFHKSNREVLETRPGYTKPQGPHVDTWFGHATSGLNLWMAIEPVRRGNGMALFPAKWASVVPRNGAH